MILCILGMSGSGKSTVEKILEKKGYHRVISCTTRPRRENEVDGKDYYFITEDEFQRLSNNKELCEQTLYREWHYCTRKCDIDITKDTIAVVNPQGYRQIKEQFEEWVIGIYLVVDDKERLIRSLNREIKPDVNEIIRRFISDKELFKDIEREVNLVIENWDTYETVEKILQFVKEHRVLDMETFYRQYCS